MGKLLRVSKLENFVEEELEQLNLCYGGMLGEIEIKKMDDIDKGKLEVLKAIKTILEGEEN